MLKKDLILRSPVEKTIGSENVTDTRFGAVLSRAGVGKTSFLVQVALTQLLKDNKILHVSLDDSMDKINLRYEEGFTNLVDSIGYVDPLKSKRLWDDIHTCKVGISYTETSFDTGKIKDYLKSFKKAEMDCPSLMVLDGLNFDQDNTSVLQSLREINEEFSISIWFAMQSHREEALDQNGFPVQLATHNELFDKAVFLKPVDNRIEAIVLKDGDRTDSKHLLNPATMMVLEDE